MYVPKQYKIKPATNCNWSYGDLFNGIKGDWYIYLNYDQWKEN